MSITIPQNQQLMKGMPNATGKKNLVLGAILALIFGPLGLFYASVFGGIFMTILGILVYLF